VGKRVNGALVQGFLYQGKISPVAQLDGSQQVVSRFVYGSRANVPDYMIKGGITYRLISDHLGSVRLVVKADDGSVMQRIDYDEFGRITQNTAPGFQPFAFAGGLGDEQTGLVRFGYRDYDPESGRWTAKDPLGLAAGQANLYTYVENQPLNAADPTGLSSCPTPPIAPPGVDLNANIRRMEQLQAMNVAQLLDPSAAEGANPLAYDLVFANLVRPGGRMDYRGKFGSKYEDFGNFNFGATAAASGFSDDIILTMAGVEQIPTAALTHPRSFGRQGSGYLWEWGMPWNEPDHGDDPRDQDQIRNGIKYYQNQCDTRCPT
jgi:RHS repeat-associated protein